MERDLLLYLHELNELDRLREMSGDRESYFEWIEQNELRDAGLNALRIERTRKAAKDRQARRRKKTRAKKRDEIKGTASDIEQTSTNLRDIWAPLESTN
jgi:hypothetical protein